MHDVKLIDRLAQAIRRLRHRGEVIQHEGVLVLVREILSQRLARARSQHHHRLRDFAQHVTIEHRSPVLHRAKILEHYG